MRHHRIAITGVGGGVGQSIIKSLYDKDYELIGLDGELLAAGLFAVPKAFKIPYARSKNFIEELLNLCATQKIELLFPGLDAELLPLSLNRAAFEAIGTTVVVSSPEVIEISDNKMLTYQKLTPFGVLVPKTIELDSFAAQHEQVQLPVIVKQKIGGARSKNVFLFREINEIEAFIENNHHSLSNYIVQEFIDGDEYTCGSVNLDGQCKGVIVMRRILRDGDTYKCFVEENPVVEETVRNVMKAIKPFGACNVQLRLRDNQPYVFEINARCSGTTASRSLCGFNEPAMIADYLLKGNEVTYDIRKLVILRYWKELVVENEEVNHLAAANALVKNNFTKL